MSDYLLWLLIVLLALFIGVKFLAFVMVLVLFYWIVSEIKK